MLVRSIDLLVGSALPFLPDDGKILVSAGRLRTVRQREHLARVGMYRFINHIRRWW